jgi:hypothetical protein
MATNVVFQAVAYHHAWKYLHSAIARSHLRHIIEFRLSKSEALGDVVEYL